MYFTKEQVIEINKKIEEKKLDKSFMWDLKLNNFKMFCKLLDLKF